MTDSAASSVFDMEKNIEGEDSNDPVLVQIMKNVRFFCKKSGNTDSDARLKNAVELNKNIKELEQQAKQMELIQKDELIIVIRDLLIDREGNIRKEACKCLRRLINTKSNFMIEKYKQYKIHLIISRNIEKDLKIKGAGAKSPEAIECKRFLTPRPQVHEELDKGQPKNLSFVPYKELNNSHDLER
jgi:hypothetical protein